MIQNPVIHLHPKEIELLRENFDIEGKRELFEGFVVKNSINSSITFPDEMNEDEANTGITEDDPYFLLAQRLANAPQVRVPLKEEGEVTTPGKTSITFST